MDAPLSRRSLAFRLGSVQTAAGAVAVAAGIAAGVAGVRFGLLPAVACAAVSATALFAASAFTRSTTRAAGTVTGQLERLAAGLQEAPLPLAGPEACVEGWNRLVRMTRAVRVRAAVADAPAVDSDTLDALPLAVVRTDAAGVIVEANRMAALLAGEMSGEGGVEFAPMAGCAFSDWLPAAADLADSGRAVASRTLDFGEGPARTIFDVDRRRLPDGSAVWTIRDTTQARLAEASRDDFVTGVAHELRSPLTNIRAYAELLVDDDGVDVEERKNFCNVIGDEAVRLSRFIDEMIDLSRMEAGALTLNRQVTDVARLVDEVIARVGPGIRAKPLTFETVVAPKLPELSVDKDKVSAAVINLLGNARKYTPEGGTVRLSVDVVEGAIAFEIEDSGFGIGEEDLGRVFEKFYRAGDERVHAETGSGLGLPFVREVARLHGGTAEARSELHHGSVFTLAIPIGGESEVGP